MNKARDKYYDRRIQRHREMADYHGDMVDERIHEQYHSNKKQHHLDQVAKLLEKKYSKRNGAKKDIGPLSSNLGAPIT